jgi:hypothetical protein
MRHFVPMAAGWYLLIPPTDNLEEPRLSRWTQSGAFSTAELCEQTRVAIMTDALREKRIALKVAEEAVYRNEKFQRFIAATMLARCIASDDPRLTDDGGGS